MTKLPKKVLVSGHTWKVERAKLGDTRAGEAEYPSRIIRVDTNIEGEYAWLVFYHEYRHAWQFENGWMQILEPQVRELDCDQFATMMVSLQRQDAMVPKKLLK